jgi:energy-coupling factor transport system ATP-binding protein
MKETMTETLPFIHIDNVSYTHWNQTEPTLKGLSLQIEAGTLNVLVGPGGSGKSTLCSLFNGEIPHLLGGKMEGKVLIEGKDTRELTVSDLSQQVGHVLQDPETMFATLYVEDEIAFGPENLEREAAEILATVQTLLDMTDLRDKRSNLVWALSGGQIQKLGLAAVLAMNPRLIVLDEPTANLDPAATHNVHELILQLREGGMTIVLITRELDDFLLSHADQLLVMNDGQIFASGHPQAVLLTHGMTLTHDLGIWLPETVEVALALHARLGGALAALAFTSRELLSVLRQHGFLKEQLQGRSDHHTREIGEILVEAQGMRYAYDAEFEALKGVDLHIRQGEMLAIIGRNGAGKSTLAKLLTGLLKPTAGRLTIMGKDAGAWKISALADHLGLVFQNPEHQFLTDSVYDEIEYSLLARGYAEEGERKRMIAATLNQLDLNDCDGIHPFALSAGKKRRLGVATMLVGKPQILILDEPTYGQDKAMTHTLMALMEEIRAQGVTIVMISHDMRLVQEYADRVIVLNEGEKLFDGTAADLFTREQLVQRANLRPTLLEEMLHLYLQEGGNISGHISNVEDFIAALGLEE